MKFLDLAMAILVGSSAMAGMVAWTPHAGDAGASALSTRIHLRDALLALLQQRGVFWFAQSSPTQICTALTASSNSSMTFSAVAGQVACPLTPPTGAPEVNLTLALPSQVVTVEAWDTAEP